MDQAYMNDNDTYMILKNTQKPKNVEWNAAHFKMNIPGYKTPLKEGIIKILNGKLLLYKTILANQRYIALIIVKQSLRRIVFSHLHAGPSGGHMEEYKTLYRIRLQLFWPKLGDDTKQWVKGCLHYVSYNV